MTLLNLKTAAAVIAAAALTGTATYLVKENEADQLRDKQSAMVGDLTQLSTEHEQALALAQSRDEQIQRLKTDLADVPGLRGEVDRLNRSLADAQLLKNENIQLKAALEEMNDAVLVENQMSGVVPPGKMITRELPVLRRIRNPGGGVSDSILGGGERKSR